MILVTGASGFVGRGFTAYLAKNQKSYRSALREPADKEVCVGNIDAATDWTVALGGVKTVVHLAARVHVLQDAAIDPLSAYRVVNVAGTLNLARQAARMGVKRFVFVSSIKVNGERTVAGQRFRFDDRPQPVEPYGLSKLEAETGLRQLASETGMELVIVRPPLVYGPGVGANFASLIRLVDHNIPLPFGAVHNARALVSRANLVDLLELSTRHPRAAGAVLLVSDGRDVSTKELVESIGEAMGRRIVQLPVPPALMQFGAALLGRPGIAQRLLESAEVDIRPTRDLLGWSPPVSFRESIFEAVAQRRHL